MWFIIILGVIAFLLMEHPIVFWVVFAPLVLLFVVSLIKWFGNGSAKMGDFITAFLALAVMVVALVLVCAP